MKRETEHVILSNGDVAEDVFFESGFTVNGSIVQVRNCISARDSFISNSFHVTIENLRSIYSKEAGLLVQSCSDLTIRESEFANSGTDKLIRGAVLGVGLRIENAIRAVIDQCEIHDNNWDGLQTVHEVEQIEIARCDCYSNGRTVEGKRTTHGDGINVAGMVAGVIRDCTLYGNARHGCTIKKLFGGSVKGDTRNILFGENSCVNNGTLYGSAGQGLHVEEGHPQFGLLKGIVVRGGNYSGQATGIATQGEVTIWSPYIQHGWRDENGEPHGNGIVVSGSSGKCRLIDPTITGYGLYGIDFRRSTKSQLIGGRITGETGAKWGIVRRGDLELTIPPEFDGEFSLGEAYGLIL